MIVIEKPRTEDLDLIESILDQWTEKEEVDKYLSRIANEIKGQTEFNMQFWVAKEKSLAVGIVGLCDPLPKVISYSKTEKPAEIKILYVDGKNQGKGVGRTLIKFVEEEALRQGYEELLVRSAKRYFGTAWGFYKKMGYKEVGIVTGGDDKKKMQVFEKLLI
jgi:GNAT superfamily N-acetyltransferase